MDSCKENEIYSNIPSIKFKTAYLTLDPESRTDTLIGIVFTYKDGDGDIGLNEADTFAPYDRKELNGIITNPFYYNVYIDYLQIINGQPQPVIKPSTTTDTLRYTVRIPSLTPDGRHKAIRGDIDHQFSPPLFKVDSDSILLRIKIYDRALHESNTIESPLLLIR